MFTVFIQKCYKNVKRSSITFPLIVKCTMRYVKIKQMKTVASIPTCIKKKYESITKIYKIEDLRKITVRQQRVVKLKLEELGRETVEKDKTMRNGDRY